MANTIKSPVNYEQGGARLTIFGENKTTGITSIYSIAFTPEPGGTYPQGMVRKNTRDKTMKYNQNGSRGTYVYTKEPIEDRKLSFNYIDDAFYWGTRVIVNVDKNILSAMFNGDSFYDGADIIKVVGTNGTRMVSPNYLTDGAQQYLIKNMGKSAMPGSDDGTGRPILVTNDDINSYSKFGLTVMIEDFTSVDTDTNQGVRYVYCAPGMPNLTVNEDGNMKAVEFDIYCDTLYIDNYFIDDLTDATTVSPAITTTDAAAIATVTGVAKAVGHGYAVNQAIKFTAITGGTGVTANTTYYVLTVPDADTFTFGLTRGGSTVIPSVAATAITVAKNEDIRAINVDYLVASSASAPTITGATTVSTVAVNDAGVIKIYTTANGGTAWTELPTSYNLIEGCLISSNATVVIAQNLTTTPVSDTTRKIIAIKTAGVTGTAVAATNKTTVGSGTATYIYTVKDFSLDTGLFVAY